MLTKLLLFLSIITVNSYILPQTFKEFHPIGIEKSINKNKPYNFNIGTLPLILWFDKNNNPTTIINTCKHLGNNLKNSQIKNNCLVCPFHKTIYNHTDNFGSTIIKDGLVWWNYKSMLKQPPSIPVNIQKKKENYKTINFKVDINVDLISCILNIMYLYNFNIKYLFKNKKLFIKSFNKYNIIKIYFKYPYTIIVSNNFIIKFMNMLNIKSIFMINILPISNNQSRLYITTKYKEGFANYLINIIHSFIIKLFIYKLKFKLEKSYNNFTFKNLLIFNKDNTDNNDYLIKIFNCYKNYMPLNDFTIKHFMINKNFY